MPEVGHPERHKDHRSAMIDDPADPGTPPALGPDGVPLDPDLTAEARVYLAMVAAWRRDNDIPPWQDMAVPAARALFRSAIEAAPRRLPPMGRVADLTVPGGDDRPRSARLFVPPALRPAAERPLLLYFHGGGYVLGGIVESEHEARRLAIMAGAPVLSVDYAHAPEHPAPAAAADGAAALTWARSSAGRRAIGVETVPGKVAMVGTSAGAGLVAAATHIALEAASPPAAIGLLSPWLDLTLSHPTIDRYGHGYGLDRAEIAWFAELTLGGGAADHRLASPGLAPIPESWPATFMVLSGADPLVGEGRAFARAVDRQGRLFGLVTAPGVPHAFHVMLHFLPGSEAALAPFDRWLATL